MLIRYLKLTIIFGYIEYTQLEFKSMHIKLFLLEYIFSTYWRILIMLFFSNFNILINRIL